MVSRDLFEKALNVFDPKRPLHGEELDRYYVARPHAPLEPMKAYLQVSQQYVKVLFSSHRGLANQSLLEYRNHEAWCDVHPVVRQLLGSP